MHAWTGLHAGLLQNDLLANISAIATEVLANVYTVKANDAEAIELQVPQLTFSHARMHACSKDAAPSRTCSIGKTGGGGGLKLASFVCMRMHACVCVHAFVGLLSATVPVRTRHCACWGRAS